MRQQVDQEGLHRDLLKDLLQLRTDHVADAALESPVHGHCCSRTATALLNYLSLKFVELLDENCVVGIQVLGQLALSLRHLQLVHLSVSPQLLLLLLR